MTTRRSVLGWSMATAVGAAAGLSSPRAQAAGAGPMLAVVVSPSSPLKNMTTFELKRLYLGSHINDPSGNKLIPFNLPAKSDDRVYFDERVLEMDPDEVARYWIDRKIRGKSGAPKSVGSPDLIQRVVGRLDHSIAYVRFDHLRSDVRAISIDGKLPSETGYSLFV